MRGVDIIIDVGVPKMNIAVCKNKTHTWPFRNKNCVDDDGVTTKMFY